MSSCIVPGLATRRSKSVNPEVNDSSVACTAICCSVPESHTIMAHSFTNCQTSIEISTPKMMSCLSKLVKAKVHCITRGLA